MLNQPHKMNDLRFNLGNFVDQLFLYNVARETSHTTLALIMVNFRWRNLLIMRAPNKPHKPVK